MIFFPHKFAHNLSNFSCPTVILFSKFSMPYIYSRPYVYSFCQIFQALRLFPALRLLLTLEYVFNGWSIRQKSFIKIRLLLGPFGTFGNSITRLTLLQVSITNAANVMWIRLILQLFVYICKDFTSYPWYLNVSSAKKLLYRTKLMKQNSKVWQYWWWSFKFVHTKLDGSLKVGYSWKNIDIISIAQKLCCVLS